MATPTTTSLAPDSVSAVSSKWASDDLLIDDSISAGNFIF
jgi:hypothetical protein